MNQEVVSRKLLIISSFITVCILFFIFIFNTINARLHLYMCNSDGKLNILIHNKDFNILINPIGEKEVLECLGKSMGYYDRNINVVISNNSNVILSINKRYHIEQVINTDKANYKGIKILLSDKIHLKYKNEDIYIYQRPLKQLDNDLKGSLNRVYLPDINEQIIPLVQQFTYIQKVSKNEQKKVDL